MNFMYIRVFFSLFLLFITRVFFFNAVFCETYRFESFHCVAEALGLASVIIAVLVCVLDHDCPGAFGQSIFHNRPRTTIAMIHICSCARLVNDSDTNSALRCMILIPVIPALVGNRKGDIVKIFIIVESGVF